MQGTDVEQSRVETLVAALLYLMTHHAHTGCPRLALCVSRHLPCLALHPMADPVVRDICASLQSACAPAGEASGRRNPITH